MSREQIPDDRLNRFHPGQVWETSRGFLWKVVSIENGQAVFRRGFNGRGAIKRRPWDEVWDGVINWVLYFDPLYDIENEGEGK